MYDVQWLPEVNTFLVLAIVFVGFVTLSWVMAHSHTSGVQTTGVVNAKNLFSELRTVTRWFQLGINLGLEKYELDNIERDHIGNERQMLQMLDLWLQHAPNAAWGDVVSALQQMGENKVAEGIRQKYIREASKLSQYTVVS